MCGLIGAYGWITDNTKKFCRQGLIVNSIRGTDSVGAFFHFRRGDGVVYRGVNAPQDYIDQPKVVEAFGKQDLDLVMGHNRAATIGGVTAKLAHPFIENHIILSHNGTVYNWKEMYGGGDIDVKEWSDSRVIAYCIARDGIDDVWWELQGAAALAYYDTTEDSFNLVTNGKRPLFMAFLKHTDTVLYASEEWIIEGLARRNGLTISVIGECDPNVLWTFKKDKKKNTMKVEDRALPVKPLPSVKVLETTAWTNNKQVNICPKLEVTSNSWDGKRCHEVMTEYQFYSKFATCSFCHTSLNGSYYTATYLHPDMVACLTCAE